MTSYAPVRVGLCVDFPFPPDAERVYIDVLRFAFDEAHQCGLLERPVELVRRDATGLPFGCLGGVIRAWQALADEDAVCIIGPLVTDNAIPVREHVESVGHVPTLSFCATEQWPGEWCFALAMGGLAEDTYLVANFLASEHVQTVSVLLDDGPVGQEHFYFFRHACRREGLKIASQSVMDPLAQDVDAAVARLDSSSDALVYLGLGLSGAAISETLSRAGWEPLRIMTSGFLTSAMTPSGMKALKGWIGVDFYDEDNHVAQAFLDRFQKSLGYRPANYWGTFPYDAANLVAHGIAHAPVLSPAGIRRGLEQVKMLPAASGGRGTLLSFAPYVRRAWLGADCSLLREATGEGSTITGELSTKMRYRFAPRTAD
jgi:ABC-type branched-subunit amino acid transport system substrate-binding protein